MTSDAKALTDAIERVSGKITDLEGEHDVMAGKPIVDAEWSLDINVIDLRLILSLAKQAADAKAERLQARVQPWMMACFGSEISADREERNHRFIEEALELVQSNGATASECHQLVDYVYGRPVGEPSQEVGGVMVTLAALCLASGLDMDDAGEAELARIWTKVDQIRAKQATKPRYSPLPQASLTASEAARDAAVQRVEEMREAAASVADRLGGDRADYTIPNRYRATPAQQADHTLKAMNVRASEIAKAIRALPIAHPIENGGAS